jgi:histidinol-phosphate aminotransferase
VTVLPRRAPIVAGLPPSKPFVGPEELARRAGVTALLRLGANESSFGPPPGALVAMRDALAQTNWYGDPEAYDLRRALAARHGCAPECVTIGAGIDDLLGLVARAFLAPGDVSVSTLGSYPTYVYHVVGYGGRVEGVPYEADGSVPLHALAERARATDARIVYLANPDNPSGSFAGRAAVSEFLAALPSDIAIVLDEAYGDFARVDELLPRTDDPRVIRLRTFSKAYGLAGARIAYGIAAPQAIAAFDKIRHHFGVNRTAQVGALAALGEEAFVADVVTEVARGRDDYHALARRLGLPSLPSRTNFVCIDLGSRARAEAMVEAMLARGIFIRKPGAPPLDGCIRVTVGTPPERARFAAAFEEILRS